MINTMTVGGIVLCGGQSKRMGRPKAWLPFAGELMLPRVVRLLRTSVEPVVVVAAPENFDPNASDAEQQWRVDHAELTRALPIMPK